MWKLDTGAGEELGQQQFDIGDGSRPFLDELFDAAHADKCFDCCLAICEAKQLLATERVFDTLDLAMGHARGPIEHERDARHRDT